MTQRNRYCETNSLFNQVSICNLTIIFSSRDLPKNYGLMDLVQQKVIFYQFHIMKLIQHPHAPLQKKNHLIQQKYRKKWKKTLEPNQFSSTQPILLHGKLGICAESTSRNHTLFLGGGDRPPPLATGVGVWSPHGKKMSLL